MRVLPPNKLTSKILRVSSVLCKKTIVATGNCNGFQDVVFATREQVISKLDKGYRVGYKEENTGIIAKINVFNTIKELRYSLT